MRITAEQVVEAYKKTGLTPARGVYFHNGCGCGLTAVTLTVDPEFFDKHPSHFGIELAELLSINQSYMDGFIRGFDGGLPITQLFFDPDYKDGYLDGASAWEQAHKQHLMKEGLDEEDHT